MPFTCSVCGEYHDEELRDIRLGLPDAIFALDDDERARRTWLADDFAALDDTWFFVRGLLELPIPEADDRFAYGAWLMLTSAWRFKKLMKQWNDPKQFKPLTCVVANELAPYVDTLGLEATLRPVSATQLPRVELHDADHQLVRDQRHGITVERSRELASVVAHAV